MNAAKISKPAKTSRKNCFPMICVVCVVVVVGGSGVRATTVDYRLDNVIMDSGGARLTGEFSWTFGEEFEDGEGIFTSLSVPFTAHGLTDLETTIDIGGSIEITFPGNFHDDGVDVTLFFIHPLTAITTASVDLGRSKYDIGGNGFHAGGFLNGLISQTDHTPGDTNGDHSVDSQDLANLLGQFAQRPGAENGDLNGDSWVDLEDFAIMRANFGAGALPPLAPEPTGNIPEPASIAIVALSGLAVFHRRRRRSLCA
ncbi:MAG: PEP-CTERM sorting domain-containing protein [Phycisphaerales bacterium]|nr:PEP-CTERM sorting domain-containing protein [Phycisphaerales bacterium]